MTDSVTPSTPWMTLAGSVLIVVVLYWAQAVVVPVALAALIAFVLGPAVHGLERWVGRVTAVLITVLLVFAVLGLAGWGLVRQMEHLADELPSYRANILAKISDVRGAGTGGAVEKLQETIDDIRTDLGKSDVPEGRTTPPVMITSELVSGFPAIGWLGPVVGPLGTAALVVVLVVFMLIERRELRDRLIGLFGQGQLMATTKAFDDASTRVSRQLLMQSLASLVYGVAAGLGLYVLNVPYPMVWGALGALLRYVPYVGPVIGAGGPLLASLAAMPGWTGPLSVLAMFVVLELFTNLVIETALYAGAAGVSQVALLIAVAFWTWLWGPLGLLMATPLTVCLVVLGRHVPGLSVIGRLMADTPVLSPEFVYYQRLLAHDPGEAADLIERHSTHESRGSVYDALLLPALNYAERDRVQRRLSDVEAQAVIDATRDLLSDAAASERRRLPPPLPATPVTHPPTPREPLHVLGYAANDAADALALNMLGDMLAGLPIVLDLAGTRMPASELVALVQAQSVSVVCIADLPPSPPSKTRYLVRRLHAAAPHVRIVVGRWSPPALADESTQALRDAGAVLVCTTLSETRAYLGGLVDGPRRSVPGSAKVPA